MTMNRAVTPPDEPSLLEKIDLENPAPHLFWFLQGFSSQLHLKDRTDGSVFIRAGCFDDKRTSIQNRLRIEQAQQNLANSVREILNDDYPTDADAILLTLGAKERNRETGNPLWAWMVLRVYLHAGLLPPKWVWLYLAQAAEDIVSGIHVIPVGDIDPLANEESSRLSKVRAEYVLQALHLRNEGGRRECLRQFAAGLKRFQLAIRVSRISSSAAPANQRLGLVQACNHIAQKFRNHKRKLTVKEAKAAAREIYKAYHEWYDLPKETNPDIFARYYGPKGRPALTKKFAEYDIAAMLDVALPYFTRTDCKKVLQAIEKRCAVLDAAEGASKTANF